MGLCTFRDKDAYFSGASEKEVRLEMLRKYLQRDKSPHIPATQQGKSESSEVISEFSESSVTPAELTSPPGQSPGLPFSQSFSEEGSDTPMQDSEYEAESERRSGEVEESKSEDQEGVSSDNEKALQYDVMTPGQFASPISQEDAAFVFLRAKQQPSSKSDK